MKLIFYFRGIIATVFLIFMTLLCGSIVIFVNIFYTNRKFNDFIVWLWAVTIDRSFNIHVRLKGAENIPEHGCLFVFNHTSDYDIMAVLEAMPSPPRFGAKTELFKIPIFGKAMRDIGTLEIFRAERAKVLNLYKNSIESVYKGEKYILAGEGTRIRHPGVGEKFKAGPFIFAISGQFPVVPIVIKGAYECLPKGRLIACTDKWRHEIVLNVLPAIPTKGLSLDDRGEFQDKVRQIMTTAYHNS